MATTLTYKGEDGSMIQLEVGEQPLTVGSSKTAGVQVLGPDVASLHCAFRLYQGNCVVKDLGSQAGTFVNEKPVELVKLHTGDRVRVGKTIFEVTDAPSRKGESTMMRDAVAELDRGKAQGKGLRTVLGEMINKGAPKPPG